MAKKNNQNEAPNYQGIRAYISALAVMLIIIIAAICILSGCLDKLIVGSGDVNPDKNISSSDSQNSVPDSDAENTEQNTQQNDTALSPDSDRPVDTDSSFDTANTEDAADTATESPDTTKTPDTTNTPDTTKIPDTTSTPDTTETPDTTKEPDETEIPEDIITAQDNRLLYKYENKTLTITGYDGTPANVLIAEKLDGIYVKSIGKDAFASTEIQSVTISFGITYIFSGAMKNCTSLTQVYIPSSVTSIADDAFEGSENVVITCNADSYAEAFAKNHNIDYRLK